MKKVNRAVFALAALLPLGLLPVLIVPQPKAAGASPPNTVAQDDQVEIVGFYPGPFFTLALGDGLVALGGEYELIILDTADPSQPVFLGGVPVSSDVDIEIQQDLLFLIDPFYGLKIFDILSPNQPVEIGRFAALEPATFLAVKDEVVYLSWTLCNPTFPPSCSGGFRVLDIADPTAPVEVSSYELPGTVSFITIHGANAYIAWEECIDLICSAYVGSVDIYDISEPRAPVLLGSYSRGGVKDIKAQGRRAYSVWGQCVRYGGCLGELEILDVSNPASPAIIGSYSVLQGTYGTAFGKAGDYGYLGTSSDLAILNVSIPAAIEPRESLTLPVPQAGIETEESLAYVIVPFEGLYILRYAVVETLAPAAGGLLSFQEVHGISTTVQLPAGAVSQTTTLYYAPLPERYVGAGWVLINHAFDLTASQNGVRFPEFTFLHPVTVSVSYTEQDLLGVTDETGLQLARRDNEAWVSAAESCPQPFPVQDDLEQKMITVLICQAGRFALIGSTETVFFPLMP